MRKLILLAALVVLFAYPVSAGLSVKTGSFASGTGAATTTVAVTGVGFLPKAVLLWTSASTSGSGSDFSMSFGVGVSSSLRRAIWAGCLDTTDPSDCNSLSSDTAALRVFRGATPTDSGTFDVQTLDADGFTLIVDTQFAASITIHYTALGGTDITNVSLLTTSKAGTGALAVTAPAFQPNFLLLFGTLATAVDTNITSAYFNMGFTDGTNAALHSVHCTDAQNASVCGSYLRSAAAQLEIFAALGTATSVTDRYSFTSFDVNGFTLNKDESSATSLIFALSIKGGQWHVGNYTAPATAIPFTGDSGLAFTPTGLFTTSPYGTAQFTSDTGQAGARIGVGFFDGTTQGVRASSANDADATNTTYANGGSTTEGYYTSNATTGAALAEGTVSFDAAGWSGSAVTAGAGSRFGTYWVVAANATSSAKPRRPVVIQ